MVAGLCLALVAGCAGSKPAGSAKSPSGSIVELDLVTMPVAVAVDSSSKVDGVAIKVYAMDSEHPKTQPIRKGALDLLMFDGVKNDEFDNTNQCRHVWTFPGNQLPAYAIETTIGTGYLLSLGWGDDRPQTERITVIARYRPPQGRTIYSAPSYVSMPVKK